MTTIIRKAADNKRFGTSVRTRANICEPRPAPSRRNVGSNIMRHSIYILTLLVFTVISCGQKEKYPYKISDFRPELRKHIQKIVAKGAISYYPDTLALNFLKDSCTKEELLRLLKFENPLVRVRAYRAIVNRNEPDYFPILLNHLDDTTKVMWWYYDDAADYIMASDLMIRKAESEGELTQSQKDTLIDVVLTKHTYLTTAEWMIHDIDPKEKYYPIIKSIAQKELASCHNLSNTYSLAKFKKQEDIPLIKKNFSEYTDNSYCNNNYFKAIEVFPDTAFFPLLTKYFDKVIKKQKQQSYSDLKYYCRAVAQYKSQNSLDILVSITKKETYPDSRHLLDNQENVFRAIHKYKSPVYDSLYNALKPKMSDYVIKYLDKPDYNDITTW